MKAIQIQQYVKTPNDLKVIDVPTPTNGIIKGVLINIGIVIKVIATAANFFDILQIQGKYQTQPPFPWIAGYEFAGIVTKAPIGSNYKVGDRVFGGSQGSYAEFITVDAKNPPLLPIPKGFSFEEASTLFITAPTSYLAIFLRAKVQKGETVLVHAGAGGVGLMAVQMAKAAGAFVIATASTQEKLDVCKHFGADVAINYATTDWIKEVKTITKGKGCDVIYDPVGLIDSSLKVIKFEGRILVVGFAAGKIEKIAMNKLLLKQCSIMGVFWGGNTINKPETVSQVWKGILGLIEKGQLKATVFRKVFDGLENVPEALMALGGRDTWGKVVIRVNQTSKL
ncbi:hypothetical protein BC833DRAFT_527256 [Globomyces pollinis-pini]|nr:hypothetical protein BC833DRAFT_527256 [Globomyces pollinis-pini]